MKHLLCALVFLSFLGLSRAESPAPAATKDPGKIKVLILTGGHGYKPEPFFRMFQENSEITYTAATQEKAAEAYERDDLYSYDVVLMYDSPSNITDEQKARFLALFDKGIGVIVLHHALLSYPMWTEFERISGGKYVYLKEQMTGGIESSNCKANVDIPVTVVAKDHPVTAGLQDFHLRDELYSNLHMLNDITVLLTTGNAPLAWARTEKNSRVVATIVGHGQSAYDDSNFRKFLAQSIRWVAKKQ